MYNIAVYAGSFDPFTNGHLNIVKDASEVFDKVFICIAQNANKKRFTDINKINLAISECLKKNGIDNCIVCIVDGLVADFCKSVNAKYLVRGLRNTSDYLYEENIAKVNYEINPNLKTVYFRGINDAISSSMIRELMKYDKPINQYVPEEIYTVLIEQINNKDY